MFRDDSQPVRSNKPTPTVCVIRILNVIPPTTPEFKLHPATRSQSSHRDGPGAQASYQSSSLTFFWAMCCESDLLSVVRTTFSPPKWIKPQLKRLADEAPAPTPGPWKGFTGGAGALGSMQASLRPSIASSCARQDQKSSAQATSARCDHFTSLSFAGSAACP
jgi:hypothetical protein